MDRRLDRSRIRDDLLCITKSQEQTVALGKKLGRLLTAGDLVCLFGELGTGKTCLTKGLVQGMGVEKVVVTSPSFIIVNQYRGRFPVYHIDLYRLESVADVEEIGFRDYLSGEGVAVVEWASRIEGQLPEERLDIVLSHVSTTVREIKVLLRGRRYTARVQELSTAILSDGG